MIGYQLIPIREQVDSITATQEKILALLAQKITNTSAPPQQSAQTISHQAQNQQQAKIKLMKK